MKSKYDISNLFKTKPMNAKEGARIIISHTNQDRDIGKGFLSQEEIISIVNGKKDNSEEYNRILEEDGILQLMTANSHQNILNYKIITQNLNNIIASYINAMYQSDIIQYIEQLEKENKNIKKIFNVLKSKLRHVFVMTAIHAYLDIYKGSHNLETLKKVNINNFRDPIIAGMKKRREFMEDTLAYRELISKGCEKIEIDYYIKKIDALIEGANNEDIPFIANLLLINDYFSIKDKGYDGFLKKEIEMVVQPKYNRIHKSFIK